MGLPFITQENPMKANPQTGLIKSWSNSTLDVFLECQWRIYLKKVLKLKVMLIQNFSKKDVELLKSNGQIIGYPCGQTAT